MIAPMPKWVVHHGDCLDVMRAMPDASVDCCVTSPPYWGLRDYGVAGQLGLEPTPAEYVARMVDVFREVRRLLKDDGTLWLNLGDSYASTPPGNTTKGVSASSTLNGVNGASGAYRETLDAGHATKRNTIVGGLKPKDLCGIPWRVAFALQADGWYLRSDIIWSKPNPMPESVTDRPTKAHEYLFLLSKSERYHYAAELIAEESLNAGKMVKTNGADGYDSETMNLRTREGFKRGVLVKDTRNRRSVWTIPSEPFPGAHFAVMPTALVKPCVLAGCRPGGIVLDPFTGSGTVGYVALENGCGFVGVELNPAYVEIARERIGAAANAPMLDFGSNR